MGIAFLAIPLAAGGDVRGGECQGGVKGMGFTDFEDAGVDYAYFHPCMDGNLSKL